MKDILKAFYYGNIEPQEINSEFNGLLKKKLCSLVEIEDCLKEKLSEENKVFFEQYVDKYNEFLNVTAADSFVSGFRLGAQFTYAMFFDSTE